MDKLSYYIGKGSHPRTVGITLVLVREMEDSSYSIVKRWNKEARKFVHVNEEIGNNIICKYGEDGNLFDSYYDAWRMLTKRNNLYRKRKKKELKRLEEGMAEYLVDPCPGFSKIIINEVTILRDEESDSFYIEGTNDEYSDPVTCYEEYKSKH